MPEYWQVDGTDGALLPADDRGLAYGDGLFETVALRGGQARFFEYHLARLAAGCAALRIPAPGAGALREAARQAAGRWPRGTLKLIVTRGSGPRGYAPPAAPVPRIVVHAAASPPPPPARWRDGIAVRVCETPVAHSPALAGLKTLNRLEQVLARAELRDGDWDEGLMLDTEQRLICGTMSNVFVVMRGELRTPALQHAGVAGVMRRVILEQAARLGIRAEVAPLVPGEWENASEMFVSNALIGIWPVARLEGRRLNPGTVTRRLMAALAAAGVDECAA